MPSLLEEGPALAVFLSTVTRSPVSEFMEALMKAKQLGTTSPCFDNFRGGFCSLPLECTEVASAVDFLTVNK